MTKLMPKTLGELVDIIYEGRQDEIDPKWWDDATVAALLICEQFGIALHPMWERAREQNANDIKE